MYGTGVDTTAGEAKHVAYSDSYLNSINTGPTSSARNNGMICHSIHLLFIYLYAINLTMHFQYLRIYSFQ
jgi:hypothetical protein